MFINVSNPYEDDVSSPDAELNLAAIQPSYSQQILEQWKDSVDLEESPPTSHPHALEVLSEAAVFSPQQSRLTAQPTSNTDAPFEGAFDPNSSSAMLTATSNSPGGSGPGSAGHSFNIQTSMSGPNSPVDPNLMSPLERAPPSSSNVTARSPTFAQAMDMFREPSLNHKEAFLLRHFSELPGRWYVSIFP